MLKGNERRVLTSPQPGMICLDFGGLQLEAFLFGLAPTGCEELETLCSSDGRAQLIAALQKIGAENVEVRLALVGESPVLELPVMVRDASVAATPGQYITWRALNAIRSYLKEDEEGNATEDEVAEEVVANPWQSSSYDSFIKALLQDSKIALLIATISNKAAEARPLERISAAPPLPPVMVSDAWLSAATIVLLASRA